MHLAAQSFSGLASPKALLLVAAILGAILFLLIVGAIALGSAFALIGTLSWIFRAPSRLRARRLAVRARR